MGHVLTMIGSISNVLAAMCAVVAIFITIRNFKSDREEQEKIRYKLRMSELYKQVVIDTILKAENERIMDINHKLYQMSTGDFDESLLKQIYQRMNSGMHDCLKEAEMIKLFHSGLCMKVKEHTEHISDIYGDTINTSMRRRRIPGNFEQKVNEELLKLQSAIYQCYIDEDYHTNIVNRI